MRTFLLRFTALTLAAATLVTGQGLTGRRAPSFSLPDSAFQQHDILDYRGRWLLLYFLRSDNPSSKQTAQLLEARKAKAGILLVGVSPIENQGTIAKFVADTKVTMPVVFDVGQVAAAYFKATPAQPNIDLPHLFAISPNGTITKDWSEVAINIPGFGAQLDALLASSGTKK